jgi:alkylglycerol monooxygenase
MHIDLVVLAIPIYLLTIALEIVANAFRREKVYRLNNAFSNLGCGILTELYGVPLKLALLALYDWVWRTWGLFEVPSNVWTFLLVMLAADFLFYWSHRWSHTVNFFWGIHVVHHQSEDFNLTVALRQSLLHDFPDMVIYLVLALVGVDTQLLLYALAVSGIYQFFLHTEMIGNLGFLEKILNTPSNHRVHHGRNPRYLDKNYGGIFIIWDRLFGTYEPETEALVYGITTPVRSFNPIWATLDHFAHIWTKTRAYPNFQGRWHAIFGHPAWKPDGLETVEQVRRADTLKFDLPYPPALGWYVLLQFLCAYGLFAVYQSHKDYFSGAGKTGVAILLTWTLLSCAFLFEQKKIFYGFESMRLLLAGAFVGLILLQISSILQLLNFCFFGISLLVLFFLMRKHIAHEITSKPHEKTH